MYDLIGDIHGHADELIQLLEVLGYRKTAKSYYHPERKVIFLGDLIDRGPKIRQVLDIVRRMIEEEVALAVMGNHELNALAFHTNDQNRPETFLRKRNVKNIRQHGQTILQLNDACLKEALTWFQTLPLWLDLDGLRAVHACWDDQAIQSIEQGLKDHKGATAEFLQSAYVKSNPLFESVDAILKGKKAELPEGISYADKDGHPRTAIRTKWYLSPEGKTYRDYALESDVVDCDLLIEETVIKAATPYPTTAKPVFVGHYWLSAHRPTILADNVACVDYSVAKGGFLCAYRWHGEQTLNNDHFVWTTK